jgi:hypothetical protein
MAAAELVWGCVMIKKELLQKAWPDGYLAVRGVQTVGGWVCSYKERGTTIFNDGGTAGGSFIGIRSTEPFIFVDRISEEHAAKFISDGWLLPDVDTADTATWACLLKDLADAVGFVSSWSHGLTWGGDEGTGHWTLRNGDGMRHFPAILVDDPALALVMARIQLREADES